MTKRYSHVVIGAGALGTATAYWLARQGYSDVLVLEQFELGHDKGASEDHSRIIRHAYHSTRYTALSPDSYAMWSEVEEKSGVQLVFRTGGLDMAHDGTSGAEELGNYRRSLEATGINSESLTADDIRRAWPQWQITDDVVGLYQEDGGILDIRKAGAVHVALARARGVEFRANTRVEAIRDTGTHVEVEAGGEVISADHLVVCVASWLSDIMGQLGLSWSITLSQEQVQYFATPHLKEFHPEAFPMWIWHADDAVYYGFPVYGEAAIKAARDMSARWVTSETRSYVPDPAETQRIREFVQPRLRYAIGPELYSKTCVYDMPPDRDFILDRVPGHERITIGIGAGHAAKFGSLLGRILADLATEGHTNYPIAPFSAVRPALTDPDFTPAFRLVG